MAFVFISPMHALSGGRSHRTVGFANQIAAQYEDSSAWRRIDPADGPTLARRAALPTNHPTLNVLQPSWQTPTGTTSRRSCAAPRQQVDLSTRLVCLTTGRYAAARTPSPVGRARPRSRSHTRTGIQHPIRGARQPLASLAHTHLTGRRCWLRCVDMRSQSIADVSSADTVTGGLAAARLSSGSDDNEVLYSANARLLVLHVVHPSHCNHSGPASARRQRL